MIVKRLNPENETEVGRWNNFVSERGRLCHDYRWAAVLRSAYGFEPVYLYGEEHGLIVSVFPLFRVRRPFGGSELVSVPHLESGGMLNTEPFLQYFDHIREHYADPAIRIFQYRDALGELKANTSAVIMEKILPADPEEIIRSLRSPAARTKMRRSLKAGYETVQANDEEAFSLFYGLYLQKMREFGTPAHGNRFFTALRHGFGNDCRILLTRDHRGAVMGAGLYILFGKTLNHLFLVVPASSLRLKVGYLLEYRTMEMAVSLACETVVLGRCEKESGNYFYKSQLNGRAQPLYLYTMKATPDGYSAVEGKTAKEKYRSFARFWTKLPYGITNTAGPLVRKWIY
jgi:hypothetical protein